MRTVLLAMSVAVAVFPPAARADHTCAEVSGTVTTEPLLGECEFTPDAAHVCHRTATSRGTVEACVRRPVRY